MTKYIVKRPWHGVSKGDVIETDKLHPALLPNVEVFIEKVEATIEKVEATEEPQLEVATPKAKPKGK